MSRSWDISKPFAVSTSASLIVATLSYTGLGQTKTPTASTAPSRTSTESAAKAQPAMQSFEPRQPSALQVLSLETGSDGSAIGYFTLEAPLEPGTKLAASQLESCASNRQTGAKVLLALRDADPPKPMAAIPTNGVPAKVEVRIEITGLLQAGTSRGHLLASGKPVAVIVAKNLQTPFSVKLESGQEKTRFVFAPDCGTFIPLRNDDSSTYPVKWTLAVPGLPDRSGTELLWANRTSYIKVTPCSTWLMAAGNLTAVHPLLADGKLIIQPNFSGVEANSLGGLAPVTIPVSVSATNFSDTTRMIASSILVFAVLLLGGITSLMVSSLVPNSIKRQDVIEQLGRLAVRIRSLPVRLGQRVHVMLRVERHRLLDLLKSRAIFSPDFPTVITQATQGATMMDKQLDLLNQASQILRRAASLQVGVDVPPTIVSQLEGNLAQITERLTTVAPQDADFKFAGALIDASTALLLSIDRLDSTFVTPMVAEAQALAAVFTSTTWTQVFVPQANGDPAVLEILNAPYNNAATIASSDYAYFDMSLMKLRLIRDFVVLYDHTDAPNRPDLAKRFPTFLGLLRQFQWPSIDQAKLRLRELRERIFVEDLKSKLQQDNVAAITLDPSHVIVGQPSTFEVTITDPRYAQCASKAEITVTWDFGDGHSEAGWTVSHYYSADFLKKQTFAKVSAVFSINEQCVMKGSQECVKLEKSILINRDPESQYVGKRTQRELIRLLVALVPALAAYLVAARDKLFTLDIVTAVIVTFLTGFGINNLKDLLAQSVDAKPK
jgi:hypothetical protein